MNQRRVVAAVAAVAVVAGLSVVAVRWALSEGPDDVVRAYLEAARRGDVAGAVEAAGLDAPPSGQSAAALGTAPWELTEVGEPYNLTDDEAEVTAVITAGGRSGEGYFRLHRGDGRWRVTNPFVTVRVPAAPVRYESASAPADLQVLPGAYTQADPAPELIQAPGRTPVIAVPETIDRPFALTQDFAPTVAARQLFQQLSDAYIDRCLTDATCMPAPYDNRFETTDGRFPVNPRTVTWRVVRRPAVDLPGVLALAPDGGPPSPARSRFPACCRPTAWRRTAHRSPRPAC